MLQIFGQFTQPNHLTNIGSLTGGGPGRIIQFSLRSLIVIAGVYSLFNFIMAGYAFLGAGNDPKKIADAWAKIWQTILGLAFVAGSFVLAAIFGQIIFKDAFFLLRPSIPTL